LNRLCVPGVVPLLDAASDSQGRFYFVTPSPGPMLARQLDAKGSLTLVDTVRLCMDAARLLGAIATAGCRLPDACVDRFERDANGVLWLVDPSGIEESAAAVAAASHLELARTFCREVLRHARHFIPPRDIVSAIDAAPDCGSLARALAQSPALAER
jgi:hypothetical protein